MKGTNLYMFLSDQLDREVLGLQQELEILEMSQKDFEAQLLKRRHADESVNDLVR